MRTRRAVLFLLSVAIAATPILAHHSFPAEYKVNQPVKLTGVVTRVEWRNPHIWFYVDVKDETVKKTSWAYSGGALGQFDAPRNQSRGHSTGSDNHGRRFPRERRLA
ncbi:MAG TPA: DUF6152 family protein [Bryobacteraceae bacterium]|nr:DUF6152 family protein [Bryobacteraceae bacterium]